MNGLTLVPTSTEDTLVRQINDEHHLAVTGWKTGMEHAIRCGELLLEARDNLRHGQWLDWLACNFEGTRRSAARYMRLASAERTGKLEGLEDACMTAVLDALAEPKPAVAVPMLDLPPTYPLTLDQLAGLVRALAAKRDEPDLPDRIAAWVERQAEPKMTTCPDCHQPVLTARIKGETILAEPEAWLEHTICTKCVQTRNAHPGSYVHCPHCRDRGYTGTSRRPPGRMLAIDMAWADKLRVRVIGEHTDRRKGEALHALHTHPVEQEDAA